MPLHIDFKARVKKIRKEMEKKNLNVHVATKQGGVHYLLGEFAPWRSAVVIPIDGKLIGITVDIDVDRVQKGTWLSEFRLWQWALGKPTFAEVIAKTLTELGLSKGSIGLEYDNLIVRELEEIKHFLPKANLIDASNLVDTVMLVKEDAEIQFLKKAAQIADYGVHCAFESLEVGMTETELAGVAEYAMRKLGNEWDWSVTGGTEVGSGERTCYYHGWTEPATRKIIQYGDMITIDVHPMYNLYLCDQTNNAIIGKPNAKQQKLLEVWKEGVHILIDGLRPGAVGKDVALKAFKFLTEKGYGEHIAPLFGHGLGTTARIPPTISINSKDVLQPNMMVVAVLNLTEPSVGGLRIETPVRVTEKEPELFSKLPIDLTVIE
ncbi:MAG: Xaa-Pro peptidase family protein [Bacteroidia bacterium]|jgi:Xaa-Pro aminopeptidase|nr:Xaa-Pro peptidase family protein [Bacteroidia bacterium]